MTKGRYPRSVAKYIRRQKAIIRKQTQDPVERARLTNEVLAKYQHYQLKK